MPTTTVPRCPHCLDFVYIAERVAGPGQSSWHKRCLTCGKCDRQLHSGALLEHGDMPYSPGAGENWFDQNTSDTFAGESSPTTNEETLKRQRLIPSNRFPKRRSLEMIREQARRTARRAYEEARTQDSDVSSFGRPATKSLYLNHAFGTPAMSSESSDNTPSTQLEQPESEGADPNQQPGEDQGDQPELTTESEVPDIAEDQPELTAESETSAIAEDQPELTTESGAPAIAEGEYETESAEKTSEKIAFSLHFWKQMEQLALSGASPSFVRLSWLMNESGSDSPAVVANECDQEPQNRSEQEQPQLQQQEESNCAADPPVAASEWDEEPTTTVTTTPEPECSSTQSETVADSTTFYETPRTSYHRTGSLRNTTKMVIFGGSSSKCQKCNDPLYHAESYSGPGGMYHRWCLRCECGKTLDSHNMVDRQGVPYCQPCYSKSFGPKGFGYGGCLHTEL
ncbi:Cysteine-rich protein 2-binding protein [Modicella reniformis]|uniref:Cysteine-rich protein 2-binding protein n=1 Tax=Modicella reniformis TaxID=1440133 RepID=A0A9P6MA66_9FUNG|nr:Cysteine-rich protein 2-binding protein [Modicella reniformis]